MKGLLRTLVQISSSYMADTSNICQKFENLILIAFLTINVNVNVEEEADRKGSHHDIVK